MQKFFDNVVDKNGHVLAGASVTVTDAATGALSTIYSDNILGIKANPITCDSNGYFEFYAANGRYNIDVTGAGLQTRHLTDVLLEDIIGQGSDLIGFVQSGAGAVSRSSQDKMREVVSVKDFDAKGDGVTDDTTAITAWVAAISRTGTAGGGKRGYIPPGVYMWTGTVTIPASVIDGAGAYSSILRAKDSTAKLLFTKTPVYDESQGAQGVYSNFSVDGANVAAGPLISLKTQNFWRFQSMAVINSAGDGVELAGAQNGTFCDSVITSHAGANIAFRKDPNSPAAGTADGAQGNMFLKCEISHFGTRAISVEDNSFNNSFIECGFEYSTVSSLEAVRVNCAASHENTLFFRGGFIGVNTAIPVFRLQRGVTCYEGGQVQGGNVGTALFYLDGSGVLLKTAGNCEFDLATDIFFAHNASAQVYDQANYFGTSINLFNTDVGAVQDSVVTRPMYSRVFLRRGQLQFPSPQIPSSGANVLDDYAEGTFAPSVLCAGSTAGVTMTTQTGNYIKVGRLVFVSINVGASISGATAGNVTLAGLPFASSTSRPGTMAPGFYAGFPAGTVMHAQVQTGPQTGVDLYTPNNGTAQVGNRALQTTDLGASIQINLSGSYLAAN